MSTTSLARVRTSSVAWRLTVLGVVGLVLSAPYLAYALQGVVARTGAALPVPFFVVVALQIAQTSVLAAVAAWIGVVCARRAGFDAPVVVAHVERRPVLPVLRPLVAPAAAWGVSAGCAILVVVATFRAVAPSSVP